MEANSLSFPEDHIWRFIVTLRAYFDAGKTEKDRGNILSVAGYLWVFEDWVKLEKKWRRILRASGLDFFHMTDFETYNPPYEKWTPRQHLAVITRLVESITSSAAVGMAAAVVIDDYSKIAPRATPQAQIRSAYRLAAAWCMGRIAGWLRDRRIAESVSYIFEAGDKGQGYLNQVVVQLSASAAFRRSMRIENVSFEEKRKRPALQAADIFAFENNAQVQRDVGLESRPSRKSLIELQKSLQHERILFDTEGFQKYKQWMHSLGGLRFTSEVISELPRGILSRKRRRVTP